MPEPTNNTKSVRFALISVLLLISVPASAATWDELRTHYDYDASLPLHPHQLQATELSGAQRIQFTFAATDGTTVPALLYLPHVQQPQLLVLFLHGLGGSKDDAKLIANMLCPNGTAVLAIDARRHGDRKQPDDRLISPEVNRFRQNVINTIIDNRRALDYVATRADINPEKVVLVGVSMGGIFASILTAVESRIDAAALLVAGGRWDILFRSSRHPDAVSVRRTAGLPPTTIREKLAPIEPINFVGHIAPRSLFLANGKFDRIVAPRSAQALHDAAGQPKEVHWYQAGHIGAVLQCIPDLTDWLRRQLAPYGQSVKAEVQ